MKQGKWHLKSLLRGGKTITVDSEEKKLNILELEAK
jgi:hypothetical protein